MTAIAPEAANLRTTPASAHRIWRVVRLNLVNKWSTIWIPVMIMGFIWLVNFLIWWIIWASTAPADRAKAFEGTQWSGGASYLFVYMLVVGIQVISMTFPFALGYSVTRRDFYLGSALTFLLLAAGYSIGFTVLSEIEEATGGWGFGGHLFTSIYFGDGGFLSRWFIVFAAMLFFFFVGSVSGTLYMRWRMNGVLVAGAVLVLLLVGAVALIGLTSSWPAVGAWFVAMGPTGIAAWLLLPAAVAALAGYVVIRRATPKS